MAKIVRKLAKIFGINAGPTQIGQFGSLAAGSPTYTTDPDDIQGLANYLSGWYAAIVGAANPAIQDMNALFYLFAYQIAYGFQAGVAEYDATTTYYIGSIVNDGTGVLYVSLEDDNLGIALDEPLSWKVIGGGSRTVVTTATQELNDDVIIGNTAGGAFTITLLPRAQWVGRYLTIKNVGNNLLTVQGNSGQTIDGSNTYVSMEARYDSVRLFNAGNAIYVV